MKRPTRQHLYGFVAGLLVAAFVVIGCFGYLVLGRTPEFEYISQHPLIIMSSVDGKQYWVVFDDDNTWQFDRDAASWRMVGKYQDFEFAKGDKYEIINERPKE